MEQIKTEKYDKFKVRLTIERIAETEVDASNAAEAKQKAHADFTLQENERIVGTNVRPIPKPLEPEPTPTE